MIVKEFTNRTNPIVVVLIVVVEILVVPVVIPRIVGTVLGLNFEFNSAKVVQNPRIILILTKTNVSVPRPFFKDKSCYL